jgi:hypothetical protein
MRMTHPLISGGRYSVKGVKINVLRLILPIQGGYTTRRRQRQKAISWQ